MQKNFILRIWFIWGIEGRQNTKTTQGNSMVITKRLNEKINITTLNLNRINIGKT